MTTTLIILLAGVFLLCFYLWKNKKNSIKDVALPLHNTEDNLNEPIISYSIYTVDEKLQHRYLNYTHKDFPNYVGILRGQYLEIDWNVINADLIYINGVGIVKAVGRKSFYPTEDTVYTITAKNNHHEIHQSIYVRLFPQNVVDKLLVKQPSIKIQLEQTISKPTLQAMPSLTIDKPTISIHKPTSVLLNEVLENEIKHKTFIQKVKEYIHNHPKNIK